LLRGILSSSDDEIDDEEEEHEFVLVFELDPNSTNHNICVSFLEENF